MADHLVPSQTDPLDRPGKATAPVTSPPSVSSAADIERLWSSDRCSQSLGITIETVSDGRADLAMPVTETMLNGLGLCHGGMLFVLADTALALAAAAGGAPHVSTWGTINFIAPCGLGEVLSATCTRISSHGRQSIYDVVVRGRAGQTIAVFRGQAQRARVAEGEAR